MEENKDFDFNKHYGGEKETPPAFLWENLEQQLPKKRKKAGVIFWVGGMLAVAASVALVFWGVNNFSNEKPLQTLEQTETTPNTASNKSNMAPQSEQSNSIENKEIPQTTGAQNTIKKITPPIQSNSTVKNKKPNFRAYTQNSDKPANNLPAKNKGDEKPSKLQDNNQPTQLNIELPAAEIIGEKWVSLSTPQKDSTTENETKEEKAKKAKFTFKPNLYVTAMGFAHTHTFSNFSSGISLGVKTIQNINSKWQLSLGLGYTRLDSTGLQRTSVREHYFVTKTTTKQQLDIIALHYANINLKAHYNIKEWHLFGGIETLILVHSVANLRTTETVFSEKRVTQQNNVVGYTKGVSDVVPQLVLGVGKNITNRLSAELQLSHSLTEFGSQSVFTTDNKLKLNYIGLGINWRLK